MKKILGKRDGLPKSLTLLLASLAVLGCANPGDDALTPAETVMASTFLVASNRTLGTGFLVALKDRNSPGGFLPVVVTSTHLLKSTGKRGVTLPLRVSDANGRIFLIPAAAAPSSKNTAWYVKHPTLDIAAFTLTLPGDLPTPAFMPFLEEKNLEATSPRAGEDICFAGFPEGMPASEGLFPVLRAGKVASLDQSLFDLPYFLINGDVFPGDSGAPVFRSSQKGRPKIVGMIIQRIGPPAHKAMPLALAVDSNAIRETLQLLAKGKH